MLPLTNRILILDDQPEEARPLVEAFAKIGIPTLYYTGKYNELPKEPMKNIRLIFLDLRFSTSNDERTIITFLINLLKNTVSVKNGPYVLAIWSKHDNELLSSFKEELSSQDNIAKPYNIFNMEKSSFFEDENTLNNALDEIAAVLEEIDNKKIHKEISEILENTCLSENNKKIIGNGLDMIIKKVIDELSNTPSLYTLFQWEKITSDSCGKLINQILELNDNQNWNENIQLLLYRLAKANIGTDIINSDEKNTIYALTTLNQMLSDVATSSLSEYRDDLINTDINNSIKLSIDSIEYSLEEHNNKYIVKKGNEPFVTFKNIEACLEEKKSVCTNLYNEHINLFGNIQFKLFFEPIQLKNKPGNIYEIENNDIIETKKCLFENIFGNEPNITIEQTKYIELDISSACDYANNKLIRARILPGLLIPQNYSFKKTDSIYITPYFTFGDEILQLVFNYQFLTNYDIIRYSELRPMACIRQINLAEIKHHLSTYISRIGILTL